MGNESSIPRDLYNKAELDAKLAQQQREYDLKIRLLNAQTEAKKKEFEQVTLNKMKEYDMKMELLKAENELRLAEIQVKAQQSPVSVNQSTTPSTSERPSCSSEAGCSRTSTVPPSLPQTREVHASRSTEAKCSRMYRPQPVVNLDKLNCPTCKSSLGVMIFMCPNGHSSCKDCRVYQRLCGVCHYPITNTRNTALEDQVIQNDVNLIAAKEEKYKNSRVRSPSNKRTYKDIYVTCRESSCPWAGQLTSMSGHYKATHEDKIISVGSEISITIDINISSTYLIEMGTFTFLFQVRILTDKLYMFVQNIGSKFANNWNYQFHIYNKSRPRRKYEYSDVCLSSKISVDEIVQENNCCVLPLCGYVDTFLNNGVLTMKVFVKRVLF